MLKKSFVSISFTSPKKIQVLRLTSSKKSVKKFVSVALPEGLISNLKVVDEQALAKVISELWKKVGIREKSVGIVIPENSTYTKILVIPTIPREELDEAVRWQAFEYLPDKPENLILDWKIISEEKDEIRVLVVAVQKEILHGYVRAARLAGLFPTVVESPSLSLVRFAQGSDKGSLFVYEASGDAIIIISAGQAIIASSVVSMENQEEVVKVANQMAKHYSDTKIEQIVVGGSDVSENIVAKLGQSLGVQPAWIKPRVSGVDAKTFQEYIIPISFQLKEAATPEDERTVNLLPPELVKKYNNEKLKHQIWSLSLFVSLIVWISFFSVLGVYLFFGTQINILKKEDVLNQIPPEKAQYISQVENINTVSAKTLAIVSARVYPQSILNAISEAKPDGGNVLRYRIDMESGAIELVGISSTRASLISFKEALEENIDFSLVSIPISSFEQESNLDFVMNFRYLPISAGNAAK